MDLYLVGVLIMLIYWVFQSIWLIILINSMYEKNLNKIYQRISWSTYRIKLIESLDELRTPKYKKIFKYILVISISFLSVFLSWITVFFTIIGIYFIHYKSLGRPECVKNYHWKLKNIDMTYDKIIEEKYKGEKELGMTELSFEDYKEWYEEITSDFRIKKE